jgi:alkanesulfonate monooxygenase SsuD/methylene tetrahydromethanopterin reductase-like flavin-dependent oxidoreductase (luciferase family)
MRLRASPRGWTGDDTFIFEHVPAFGLPLQAHPQSRRESRLHHQLAVTAAEPIDPVARKSEIGLKAGSLVLWLAEAYTALGALAGATEKIQLSTLVTGNTYRNPTLLAKVVTTLDVVSGGRAILGIGAGWFELEHRQLGFEFGTCTERFEKLEEAPPSRLQSR